MHSPHLQSLPDGPYISRRRACGEVLLILLVFFVAGASAAPDVNEPHYLGKALHYWDAGWCRYDFFLNSADAHQTFYWSFGWLTSYLTLEATAWCGRLLTWTLLAWAWRRLSWALVPGPYYSVLSASLLITLVARFQMSGEWLIGGVEAKGFAYALVFLGLERLVRARWGAAILWFGAASAFHVVVGGWATVAAGVVWLVSADRPPVRRLALPLAGGLLLALPGLLPALTLTWHADPGIVREANRIYVYERLYHHLLAQRFPPWYVARHLLLIAVLVGLIWFARPLGERFRRLHTFVAASVAMVAVGMLLSLLAPFAPDFAAGLLKFYWFRLSDVMVPAGVSLTACAVLYAWQPSRPKLHGAALAVLMLAAAIHLGNVVVLRRRQPWPPAEANVLDPVAWRETCAWVAENTPADAVFLTPRLDQTFRWYAGRAEVVSRKDIPQDAPGIVEWWRRNLLVYGVNDSAETRWCASLAELGPLRLRTLAAEFDADYVITSAFPPLPLERVGPFNSSYAIYRLRGADENRSAE